VAGYTLSSIRPGRSVTPIGARKRYAHRADHTLFTWGTRRRDLISLLQNLLRETEKGPKASGGSAAVGMIRGRTKPVEEFIKQMCLDCNDSEKIVYRKANFQKPTRHAGKGKRPSKKFDLNRVVRMDIGNGSSVEASGKAGRKSGLWGKEAQYR